ncbi:unnamed protein product [Zymoseptoria tritici ST99CH_1A5]|uniref:Uncharacterized protein n=2 Tax=Zymoseptoria tritici TaxID=1047171 RepID=A0A2H1GFQ6_ZYMTR|nr:unnamed protein product [Zymoseptoria tritici ST99CH_1E4]SMR53493.1 unnamed protein product [Zymoseptoria tritici ST99CH_3D1]SMY24258.1 unnamed protein product [Zymoseptoria tritici ST99CH_1A5]
MANYPLEQLEQEVGAFFLMAIDQVKALRALVVQMESEQSDGVLLVHHAIKGQQIAFSLMESSAKIPRQALEDTASPAAREQAKTDGRHLAMAAILLHRVCNVILVKGTSSCASNAGEGTIKAAKKVDFGGLTVLLEQFEEKVKDHRWAE